MGKVAGGAGHFRWNVTKQPEETKFKLEARGKPMAIPKKHKNVIDLAAYRKKRFTYHVDPGPELLSPGDIEELMRQGRYLGTWTPQAPYGRQDKDKEDAS